MGDAKRDANYVPTLIAVSNADGSTPVTLYADPTTHRLLVSSTAVATPAGSDTQVQFNDGGAMGGDAGFVYNKTTDTATLAGNLKCEDLEIEDSNASHYLTITTTSDLSTGRTLTLVPGDASRTLTISGNATISQDYSTTGNPQFATIELGAASDTTLSRSAAGVLAVEGVDVILGTVGATDNALLRANGTGTHTIQGSSATATLSDNNDLTLYDATNDGNPVLAFGASATERLTITPTYDAGAQTLDLVVFSTDVASATADKGQFRFSVDGTDIFEIDDGGIEIIVGSASPSANDGASLGTTALGWSDLHLASGAVVNWVNGDITLTHSAGKLTYGGDGAVEIDFNNHEMTNVDINSGAIDGTTIGVTTPAAITGTTVDATTDFTIGGTVITDNTITDDGTLVINATTAVSFSDGNITNVGDIALDSLTADATNINLNSPLQLIENAPILLDAAGSADGKYSGIAIAGTAGATLAFGNLVYLAAADSRWELTDADAATTADRMLGICVLAAAADGDPTRLLLMGTIRADAAFPALTVGSAVYVGETAGAIQVAIPTGADNVIRRVGYALTADEIYFNPSMDAQTTVA